MQPEDGFRDDWRYSRAFTFSGFFVCVAIAAWLTFSSSKDEQTSRRIDSWLTLAGALAMYYMGRAAADGISRRQTTAAFETARLRVTPPRTPEQVAAQRREQDEAAG